MLAQTTSSDSLPLSNLAATAGKRLGNTELTDNPKRACRKRPTHQTPDPLLRRLTDHSQRSLRKTPSPAEVGDPQGSFRNTDAAERVAAWEVSEKLPRRRRRGPDKEASMVIRVFRAQPKQGKADEFAELIRTVSVPFVEGQPGLVARFTGRGIGRSGDEIVMISVWESVDALKNMTGESWEEEVIPDPREAERIETSWVHHYESMG